jgi:predicted nucleic acid-binding protein
MTVIADHHLVALARQRGCSLATLDQPLAKSFGDETGLVELLH